MLRAVRNSRISQTHPVVITGFTFNIVSRKAINSWLLDPYFGFAPKTYAPPYWNGTHKNICKKYRTLGFTKNEELTQWEVRAGCEINWHHKFRGLVHAFVDSRIRIMFWKLFTNRLYAGETAHKYLTDSNKLPEFRDNYEFCPVCDGYTKASYQHLFWDCPSVSKYWLLIKKECTNMGFTSPINEYADFIKFIDRTHCNNIVLVFKDELMYNAVYSIYCVYIALMKIINSTDVLYGF